jgi:hypothetical protein
MPTDNIFTGRESRLLFKDETTFGALPSGDFAPTWYYTHGLAAAKPRQADPLLGIGYATPRDATDPAPGLMTHGGALVVPLDVNHIGHWLKLVFGAPTTTGSTNLTHEFVSGAAQLPTRTVEIKSGPTEFRRHLGLAARTARFMMTKEAGFRRVELDLVGKGERKATSSVDASPAAALGRVPVASVVGTAKWEGSLIGRALAAEVTYGTGLDADRYLDSSTEPDEISAVVPTDETSLVGQIRVRAPNATLDDAGIGDTPGALELEWALSGTLGLKLTMPRVFLERSGRPIDGPGGTEQVFALRAAQSAADPMLTATLKNQVASY